MSNVIIRAYLPSDRQAVRNICADTSDKGGPVENLFPDRESITDLISAYYTDYEPESLFIAEHNGNVIGYIMGCFDNRRYGLAMLWIIFPKALSKAFFRGAFFKRQCWELIGDMLKNWHRLFAWRKESFHSHTGHMHIAIAENFRKQHIDTQLLGVFRAYAGTQHADCPGV